MQQRSWWRDLGRPLHIYFLILKTNNTKQTIGVSPGIATTLGLSQFLALFCDFRSVLLFRAAKSPYVVFLEWKRLTTKVGSIAPTHAVLKIQQYMYFLVYGVYNI